MSEDRVSVKIESVTVSENKSGAAIQFVTLQDDGERQMRVYIGKPEAQALSLGLRGYPSDRPSTYEALISCLTAAEMVVEEVSISDLRDETFYADVRLRINENIHSIDMRPSDALNIAVRTKCPLFVSEKVFLASLPPEESSELATQSVTVTRPIEKLDNITPEEVSEELARLYSEDQSDRTTAPQGQIDWQVVAPRDTARLSRIKQFYRSQSLKTGMDFYHAAMILQHAHTPEDYLLAHEFCIVAISKGTEQAKWLAAASEDRYLMNMGLPQRFGTQYRTSGPDGEWSLYDVSPDLTDDVRQALDVPTLFQAQSYSG